VVRYISVHNSLFHPRGIVKWLQKSLSLGSGQFESDRSGQNGQIVEWNTKRLRFGPIWPKNLDKIRMRSIFASYLRNIDQIFPLIQRK
jgi:hypothetical protein